MFPLIELVLFVCVVWIKFCWCVWLLCLVPSPFDKVVPPSHWACNNLFIYFLYACMVYSQMYTPHTQYNLILILNLLAHTPNSSKGLIVGNGHGHSHEVNRSLCLLWLTITRIHYLGPYTKFHAIGSHGWE